MVLFDTSCCKTPLRLIPVIESQQQQPEGRHAQVPDRPTRGAPAPLLLDALPSRPHSTTSTFAPRTTKSPLQRVGRKVLASVFVKSDAGMNLRCVLIIAIIINCDLIRNIRVSVDVKDSVAMLTAFHASMKASFVPAHIILQLMHQVPLLTTHQVRTLRPSTRRYSMH